VPAYKRHYNRRQPNRVRASQFESGCKVLAIALQVDVVGCLVTERGGAQTEGCGLFERRSHSRNEGTAVRLVFSRFLILTTLAIAALCVLQSPSAFADDPPKLSAPYGCGWKVTCGGMIGSGTVHGYPSGSTAQSAASAEAKAWKEANCGTSMSVTSITRPYQEIAVMLGAEAPATGMQGARSTDEWVVLYRCRSRNGNSFEVEVAGGTFCEAYTAARNFVCNEMSDPYYGGACCCCYRVVERPCCNRVRSCCP